MVEWELPGAVAWGKQGNVGQRVQAVSHQMNLLWGSNAQHSAYSYCYIVSLKFCQEQILRVLPLTYKQMVTIGDDGFVIT